MQLPSSDHCCVKIQQVEMLNAMQNNAQNVCKKSKQPCLFYPEAWINAKRLQLHQAWESNEMMKKVSYGITDLRHNDYVVNMMYNCEHEHIICVRIMQSWRNFRLCRGSAYSCQKSKAATSSGYACVVLKVKPPLPGKHRRTLGLVNPFTVEVARAEQDCRPRQQASSCPGHVPLGNKQNPDPPPPKNHSLSCGLVPSRPDKAQDQSRNPALDSSWWWSLS